MYACVRSYILWISSKTNTIRLTLSYFLHDKQLLLRDLPITLCVLRIHFFLAQPFTKLQIIHFFLSKSLNTVQIMQFFLTQQPNKLQIRFLRRKVAVTFSSNICSAHNGTAYMHLSFLRYSIETEI